VPETIINVLCSMLYLSCVLFFPTRRHPCVVDDQEKKWSSSLNVGILHTYTLTGPPVKAVGLSGPEIPVRSTGPDRLRPVTVRNPTSQSS